MIYHIDITIKRVEGAIIRTLGLAERRGFAVRAVSTGDSACEDQMAIALTVESPERSVDVLIRQIEKLFDVCGVTRRQVAAQHPLKEQMAC